MHCHFIVSRKDQSNKVKISPLTNHRNTKNGAIKGGFDRTTLFENVEKGFDRLFGYNRQLSETFEYCNTMKNGSITDKLKMQERELNDPEQNIAGEKKNTIDTTIRQQISTSISHPDDGNGLSSLFSILPSPTDAALPDEQQQQKPKKKKKRKKGISRQS